MNDIKYLQELDIQHWELAHPERLEGYQMKTIDFPDSCKLLFVSPVKPTGDIVIMFEKVLKSIGLKLHHSLHITPQQFSQLGKHQLDWVWFSGCERKETDVKTLISPLLSDIDGNQQERRNLWQQICSYDIKN